MSYFFSCQKVFKRYFAILCVYGTCYGNKIRFMQEGFLMAYDKWHKEFVFLNPCEFLVKNQYVVQNAFAVIKNFLENTIADFECCVYLHKWYLQVNGEPVAYAWASGYTSHTEQMGTTMTIQQLKRGDVVNIIQKASDKPPNHLYAHYTLFSGYRL